MDAQGHTLSHSPVPRYIQLATLFRRRIETGRWKPGGQVPTVDELAAECGVARATIRQAMGVLEAAGLVERFRAKGTFVRPHGREQLWCEVETNFAGLLRSREGAEIELLSDLADQPPRIVPHPVGTPAPSYRHLRRRHRRAGTPFLLAEVWIDERLRPAITPDDLVSKTALKLVAGIPGMQITDARQTLTIASADMDTARQLALPLNAPVACVHRSAVDQDGCLVMIGEGLYRGDLVRLDVRLR